MGIFTLLLRRLMAQKRQLALTIIAVAWATLSISSLLSIGEGLRISLEKSLGSSGKNILTVQAGQTAKSYKGVSVNTPVHLTQQNILPWKHLPDVQAVSSSVTFSARAINGHYSAYVSPQAVSANFPETTTIEVEQPGRFISILDEEKQTKTAVIGTEVAKSLFPHKHNVLGRFFYLGEVRFKVIGVLHRSIAASSLSSNGVLIPISTFFALSDQQYVSYAQLLLKKSASMENTQSQLLSIIAIDQHFAPKDEGALFFESTAKKAKTMNTFLTGFQILLGVIGSMTLLVAGVGVANVMLMSIKKATKTIGLQMAVGATYTQVLIQYFLESFLVTATGGGIGILLTITWIQLFGLIPFSNKIYKAMGNPRPVLSIGVFFAVGGILTVIGFFAAYFPARKAARINPAVALHEE